MPYLWIILGCYGVAFVAIISYTVFAVRRDAREMQARGISEDLITQYRREQFPFTCLAAASAALVNGLVLGLVGSTIFWLASLAERVMLAVDE
jgi:hypothetical protein